MPEGKKPLFPTGRKVQKLKDECLLFLLFLRGADYMQRVNDNSSPAHFRYLCYTAQVTCCTTA